MDFRFRDANLASVFEDDKVTGGFSEGVIKAFRKRMQQIMAAEDERLFYTVGGMRFEKLERDRKHQYSMRLNDQFRLILEFEGEGQKKTVVVVEIVDYH